ncbi:hypothetical protein B0A50_00348 [Salinomyces thailandicus]|uniref:AB hydrolase-1 domain-containing protein n=1 Tax=Salinomyces thailandicus TaxID=706561 RepID=A0A4U0UHZ4_9PEZI|nr:hypothetical protein B0A50_00348 [Salinomyces thailandica]
MKPPILIVHGAFHILTHFTSLVTLLRHEGHKVLVPALPSTDISSDSGNANTLEAAKIRHELSTLIEETEKMAVGWLLHSDGGQFSSEAIAAYLEAQELRNSSSRAKLNLIYQNATLLAPIQDYLGLPLIAHNPYTTQSCPTASIASERVKHRGFGWARYRGFDVGEVYWGNEGSGIAVGGAEGVCRGVEEGGGGGESCLVGGALFVVLGVAEEVEEVFGRALAGGGVVR